MTIANLREVGTEYAGALDKVDGGSLIASDRVRLLHRRASYYAATQHDSKRFDFDGRVIQGAVSGGVSAMQPLLVGSERYGDLVPLSRRRPSAPYRLGRTIVASFTSLLFGEKRFPKISVPSDSATQDYVECLAKEQRLSYKLIRARNLGGATGSIALSWAFRDGKPCTEVHDPRNVYVASWIDRDAFVPEHVVECFQYSTLEWDQAKRRIETVWWWYRRDWTPSVDVAFVPCRVEAGKVPLWEVDDSRVVEHQDGICHFTWGQNLPSDEVDGEPDYEGMYEPLDMLDVILSVISRGASLNLDPTLVLKMDPDQLRTTGVKKGSEQALAVGETGDAKYLEVAGTSITSGLALFKELRKTVLETAQCVIPDPDEITANGVSSVAMKALYRPMVAKADVLREQYGDTLQRHLEPQLKIARKRCRVFLHVVEPDGTLAIHSETLDLPPRIQRVAPDAENPAGRIVEHQRDPGEADRIDLDWPEYFPPTPEDQAKVVTTMSSAVGGSAVLSLETATEEVATFLGRDPDEEKGRMQAEQLAQHDQQMSMFQGMPNVDSGATVTHSLPGPGGGMVRATMKPQEPAPDPSLAAAPPPESDGKIPINLTPTTQATILKVNEARILMGLSPLEGEEGEMSLVTYAAKYASGIATGTAATMGQDPNAPPPPPKFGGGPPR